MTADTDDHLDPVGRLCVALCRSAGVDPNNAISLTLERQQDGSSILTIKTVARGVPRESIDELVSTVKWEQVNDAG